jgi:N-acetylgalactosamine-6-sulfatase
MEHPMRLLPFLAACLLGGVCESASAADKPNVVFILADDLGYGDLKCYAHPHAKTPNLDKLAEQGTRFTQYYSNGATCCPARTALMTGKFCATYKEYPADFGFGKQVTVTELLKKAGYHTGHFGKWHIGQVTKPGTYGIDTISGAEDGIRAAKRAGTSGRDAPIFDEAMKFIEKNKAGPFYVNIWGHISHNPVNPAQALVDRWKSLTVKPVDFPPQMREKFALVEGAKGDISDGMRRYLADVESLDADVGRLLKKLDDLGLSKKTIVVFSSDQGADMTHAAGGGLRFNQMGYNGPHRGGKHTFFEGGQRVPFIVRWPGHVAAKAVNEKSVVSGIDWLPTLCGITGVKIAAADFDGEDVSGVWLGKDRERTKPLFWKTNNVRSEMVVRDGPWKLFEPTKKKGERELFHIPTDPAEKVNVAEKNPAVVAQLKAKIAKWNATLPKEYTKSDDKD